MARKFVTRIIKSPRGFSIRGIETDPRAIKYVIVIFQKKNAIGKLLKIKRSRKVRIPRGFKLMLFENNRPKVRQGFLKFKKI